MIIQSCNSYSHLFKWALTHPPQTCMQQQQQQTIARSTYYYSFVFSFPSSLLLPTMWFTDFNQFNEFDIFSSSLALFSLSLSLSPFPPSSPHVFAIFVLNPATTTTTTMAAAECGRWESEKRASERVACMYSCPINESIKINEPRNLSLISFYIKRLLSWEQSRANRLSIRGGGRGGGVRGNWNIIRFFPRTPRRKKMMQSESFCQTYENRISRLYWSRSRMRRELFSVA